MKLKPLGKTDTKISEIGQGTWQYRGGMEPLRVGISLGATHIDTAEMYKDEDVVGKAIEGLRDQVFIATKVSPDHLHHDDLINAAERSLKLLNIKTIDLYQVHWPNPKVPINETMQAMEELVKRRKIKYIGVSNFSVRELKDAQNALSSNEIVSNQVPYNLQERKIEDDLLPYCKTEKITIIAYSPLARGGSVRSGKRKDVLDEMAARYKKTRAQVALNFVTREDNVVAIPKADNVEHLKENCGASDWRLSEQDIKLISEQYR
jgi:diketogulonate reductase-like aldo/keto reductase